MTTSGSLLFKILKQQMAKLLSEVDQYDFSNINNTESQLRAEIEDERGKARDDDDYLLDLFVLDRYLNMITAYCNTWNHILAGRYSESWISLQDSLDAMRLIKKFSNHDVSFFEDQLLELEPVYPFEVFFSVGMKVGRVDCSICGKNIDLLECPHRRGEIYNGVVAYGIVREIVELDHVSVAENPEDKRCVAQFENEAYQFNLIRQISDLIRSKNPNISDIRRLEWSKRSEENPEYIVLGRNDLCFCGSENKFKRCCIEKKMIESDHVDVVIERKDICNVIV